MLSNHRERTSGPGREKRTSSTNVTLTDIKAVFLSLKSELGLRPIFHHKAVRAFERPANAPSGPRSPTTSCPRRSRSTRSTQALRVSLVKLVTDCRAVARQRRRELAAPQLLRPL